MNKIKTTNFINIPIFAILDSELKNNKIKRDFHYIKFNKEIRWVIENDNSTLNILKKWRPYNYLNFFFWRILIIFKKFKLINFLPFINRKKLQLSNDFLNLKQYSSLGKLSFAFYLGKKSHPNRKSTIFVINKDTKKCIYIIKRAITDKSWEALQKEFLVLKRLQIEKNIYSPKPLYLDKKNRALFQDYIEGDTVSLNLRREHYKFLASLINKKKLINLLEIRSLFKSFYESKITFLNNKEIIYDLEKSLSLSIWHKKIPSVRVHGDFAPWNLKFNKKSKKLIAYDWEDSIESFLPFYDLIFYKLSVKKLLNKKIEISKKQYLIALQEKGCNLNEEIVDELCFISKVFFLIKSKLNSNDFES